jgi:hypothetical protein
LMANAGVVTYGLLAERPKNHHIAGQCMRPAPRAVF